MNEQLLEIKALNLKLHFNIADCSGIFEYPNGLKRKASTSEIMQFFTLELLTH